MIWACRAGFLVAAVLMAAVLSGARPPVWAQIMWLAVIAVLFAVLICVWDSYRHWKRYANDLSEGWPADPPG